MRWTRSWLVVATVICIAGVLRAEEPGEESAPKPLTAKQTVEAVLEAVRVDDADTLKALAKRDQPDPWRVADDLCARGAHDAAEAFASAAPRPDVEHLPAYVERRRSAKSDAAFREAAKLAAEKMDAHEFEEARRIYASIPADGESVLTARIQTNLGSCLYRLGRFEDAIRAYRRCVETCRRLGWHALPARTLVAAVGCAQALRDDELALALSLEWLAVERDRGLPGRIARAHGYVAHWHGQIGNRRQQFEHLEKGMALAEAAEAWPEAAQLALDRGAAFSAIGRAREARRDYARCFRIREAIGDRLGAAHALRNIAISHTNWGEYRASIPYAERALEIYLAQDDEAGATGATRLLGSTRMNLGELAEGLTLLEKAVRMAEAAGDLRALAAAYGSLALAHARVGQPEKADEYWQRDLQICRQRGSDTALANTLRLYAFFEWGEGRHVEAHAHLQEAIALAEAARSRDLLAHCLRTSAHIAIEQGALDTAVAHLDRAESLSAELGDDVARAHVMRMRGHVLVKQKDLERAVEMFEASRRSIEEAGGVADYATAYYIAACHLEMGNLKRCMREAKNAVHHVLGEASGLAELERGGAKDRMEHLFRVGTTAAVRADDVESALFFLESGRATGLREILDLRRSVRAEWVDEETRGDLARLDSEEAAALANLRRARASGRLADQRRWRKKLDRTRTAYQEVIDRLQRRKGRKVPLLYPQTASLEEVQDALDSDEALVIYGRTTTELVAAVVRRASARIVPLTTADDAELTPPGHEGELADTDWRPLTERWRALLVAPLALEPDVRRVLVSPAGPLAYVPFSLLVGDREVGLVPSATTYAELLADEDLRGVDVLAFGDPDYRTPHRPMALAMNRSGRRLLPLPHTRGEVEAVGDRVYLGTDANEANLADALTTRPRWRAVHFACHGLLDAERPMFSSLALTPTDATDGFLTVHEVLRTRVAADLVVLSACETGRGKIFLTEGVVGLTRAFMCGGAPRVLVSLWDVDDMATQALMVEFYELWNPEEGEGLGAAAALMKAQDHIRSQERWKDPRYWAAWVLWGLPN